jgi:hypothetical protein
MTADDLRCLDKEGYLVLPARQAVSREILLHLETLFEQAGENAGHAFRVEPFIRTVGIAPQEMDPNAHGPFAPLNADPTMLACVEHLLGRDYGLAALRAHSSNPFALALDPLRSGPGAWACQVFWLLDDFSGAETAALRVVPRSHLVDPSLKMFAANLPAEAVMAPAGSALILHGRLWSGGAANPGDRHLRTLRCEYLRREARNSG